MCARPSVSILLIRRVLAMLGRNINIDSHKPTCGVDLVCLIRQSGQTPYPPTKTKLTHVAHFPPGNANLLSWVVNMTVIWCKRARPVVPRRRLTILDLVEGSRALNTSSRTRTSFLRATALAMALVERKDALDSSAKLASLVLRIHSQVVDAGRHSAVYPRCRPCLTCNPQASQRRP